MAREQEAGRQQQQWQSLSESGGEGSAVISSEKEWSEDHDRKRPSGSEVNGI